MLVADVGTAIARGSKPALARTLMGGATSRSAVERRPAPPAVSTWLGTWKTRRTRLDWLREHCFGSEAGGFPCRSEAHYIRLAAAHLFATVAGVVL